jgi:hypothetical protein
VIQALGLGLEPEIEVDTARAGYRKGTSNVVDGCEKDDKVEA